MSLFFYVPFSIVLMKEGYPVNGVLGWFFAMLFIIQATNFLNFLINKNNIAFWVIAIATLGLISLQLFDIFYILSLRYPM